MVLDFRDLTWRELVVGAAGIALLVTLFAFTWYAAKVPHVPTGEELQVVEADPRNAFGAFTWLDIGLLATASAAIALPLLSAVRPKLRLGRWPALVVATLAIVAVASIAFRLLDPPDLARTFEGTRIRASDFPDVEVIRKTGAWLGLALSAVIALAASLQTRSSWLSAGGTPDRASPGARSASPGEERRS
ncbi:MAG TPA: hypothetical protein VK919_03765 [Solirubrobacterales bacterium]|nr:hypothetical protein [Solirubrobacterales bacterium]